MRSLAWLLVLLLCRTAFPHAKPIDLGNALDDLGSSSAFNPEVIGGKRTPNFLATGANSVPQEVIQKRQRDEVLAAVGSKAKEGDIKKLLDSDPAIRTAVETGDPAKVYEALGATSEDDKKAANTLMARNMAQNKPEDLYKHFFDQKIAPGKPPKRKTELDTAVAAEVKTLSQKHEKLLKQFEAAGVRGPGNEWRAIRAEMSAQAISKAKQVQNDKTAPQADKDAAWAAAGKSADGFMSSITNRPKLAATLLDTSNKENTELGRFLGRAAEASTMTPVNAKGQGDLTIVDKNELAFKTGFRNEWVADGGGLSRIKEWNEHVAQGNTKVLDQKYPGWTDHAVATRNVEATWLAKAKDGVWEYEVGGNKYALSNKSSLQGFFAAMDKHQDDPAQAFAAMKLVQENQEAMSRTGPRAPASGIQPVSLGGPLRLDGGAAIFAPQQTVQSDTNPKGEPNPKGEADPKGEPPACKGNCPFPRKTQGVQIEQGAPICGDGSCNK